MKEERDKWGALNVATCWRSHATTPLIHRLTGHRQKIMNR